jgi:hypothetical protein
VDASHAQVFNVLGPDNLAASGGVGGTFWPRL